MSNQNKDNPLNLTDLAVTSSGTPALTLDVEYYQHLLDDADMSEENKREFIEALWSIVVSFVDLGFGIHPLQAVLPDEQSEPDTALADLIANMNPHTLKQQSERENSPERKDT